MTLNLPNSKHLANYLSKSKFQTLLVNVSHTYKLDDISRFWGIPRLNKGELHAGFHTYDQD